MSANFHSTTFFEERKENVHNGFDLKNGLFVAGVLRREGILDLRKEVYPPPDGQSLEGG